jgi:uncharacterized protein
MPPVTAYFPQPRISVDGRVNEALGRDTVSLSVEETTDGLYTCDARFVNFGPQARGGVGYLYFGRDVLEFGKEVAVELGSRDASRQVFTGRISALEAHYATGQGPEIVMLAEDRLQTLRMTRRTRTFEDVTDEDVMRQIAQEHSLTPQLDVSGPNRKVLAQVNQSDLAFLRERARSVNAELWVEGNTLYAKSRGERAGSAVNLEYGVNLMSFSVRADLAHQCSEVGVSGWDVSAKDGIEETANADAISSELGSDTSGGSILETALGARKERLVHTAPFDAEEARAMAEARYRERARRFVTGAGVADGMAELRVGATLSLSGLGGLFDGNYYAVRVRHVYDLDHGYRTEFAVERPGLGQAA